MSTVAATEAPVALVRASDETADAEPTRYGEIVVGVGFHEAADKVLAFAFEEASRRDCALRAVHGRKLPSSYEYVPFFDPDNERDIRSVTQVLDETLLPWRVPSSRPPARDAAEPKRIRPLLADPDGAVHGRQPLLRIRKDSYRPFHSSTAGARPTGPVSPQRPPDGPTSGGQRYRGSKYGLIFQEAS
ncbi:hypothetical protein [Streptomyces sp. NPDC093093]|uniref:hypothetical protein n=1 Tax=Streptomyces sp. NPDC093093 TaxID=3366025 RepID=UPI0037FB4F35